MSGSSSLVISLAISLSLSLHLFFSLHVSFSLSIHLSLHLFLSLSLSLYLSLSLRECLCLCCTIGMFHWRYITLIHGLTSYLPISHTCLFPPLHVDLSQLLWQALHARITSHSWSTVKKDFILTIVQHVYEE